MVTIEKVTLNQDQEIGVEKIKKFFKSSEKYFLLTGKAGTGKTTMIYYALEKLIESDLEKYNGTGHKDLFKSVPNVMGIALAHKAKFNLQRSIPFVNTFASAYAHREHIMENGRRKFVMDKKKIKFADCKKPVQVFVMDECSMFSHEMLNLVSRHTNMFAKIIFMGDRGQLPPVLDNNTMDVGKDSPVFDMILPDYCKHELKTRVRQTEGNPIIDISDKIYDLIFTDPSIQERDRLLKEMMETKLDDKGHGHQIVKAHALWETYKNCSDDYLDTKVVAYRRRTVDSYNYHLRNYIHDNPAPIFIPKEIIYMNKTYFGKDIDEQDFVFYNSSEYIIQDTQRGELEGIQVLYAFLEEKRSMPYIIGGHGSKNYEIFKDRVNSLYEAKNYQEMWRIKDMFADFSYGYALTAYKAQGSTYKNIFIDVNDILTLNALQLKRQLQSLYTAVTRASHNVYFIKS